MNNEIHGLFNKEGRWCDKDSEMEEIITDYFGELFQSFDPDLAMIDEVLEMVDTRIDSEMGAQLNRPFTSDEASVQEAEVVRSILDTYAAVSGQIINMEKSTMVFSPKIRPSEAQAISQILPLQVVAQFDRYLGLPAQIGRTKVEVFNYLKDWLWSRVHGWSEKHISMAGREILIKSVLQAIPTYVMLGGS